MCRTALPSRRTDLFTLLTARTAGCRSFHPEGDFLREWPDIARPCQVAFDADGRIYIAELGYRSGMWPGTSPPSPACATGGRVSVFDPGAELIARWGGGENPTAPGDFYAPHDITIDSREATCTSPKSVWSAGAKRGLVDPTCHSLQKFLAVSRESSK